MKMLICTQKVDINDPILGFFHRWIEEFSKHCEKVIVICLERGEYKLPGNVEVLSLGKEGGRSRSKYLLRFYKYIWQERKNYDTVFVHMNPEYMVLGGLLWSLWHKRTGLWYVHRHVNYQLRWAEKLSGQIFTAAPESFGLKSSRKIKVVGHGIDVGRFNRPDDFVRDNQVPVIISVGRITKIKRLNELVEALTLLNSRGMKLDLKLVGSVVSDRDDDYLNRLKLLISASGLESRVEFVGPVGNDDLPRFYWSSDLHVNLAPTGGVDKAPLEAMVAGIPSIVCNTAFKRILGSYAPTLLLEDFSVENVADKIYSVITGNNDWRGLAERVRSEFNLESLVDRIIKSYEDPSR